ncbi:hypothetical protein HYH03_014914 [Edaphochlamys debaryana]|uniref:SET domain-containing protein n=1 Tax=Edaphochlamys debaryana TaxID=47281 RepID=A0A835XKJ3_9CHLO|nr:hypothetical protein HYH03_014914 [Edaphochlamys debaryana]|eukprot:KAG2486467.1 hypothetical protein HYH03_014914 [Edaphochlamys debaryana]
MPNDSALGGNAYRQFCSSAPELEQQPRKRARVTFALPPISPQPGARSAQETADLPGVPRGPVGSVGVASGGGVKPASALKRPPGAAAHRDLQSEPTATDGGAVRPLTAPAAPGRAAPPQQGKAGAEPRPQPLRRTGAALPPPPSAEGKAGGGKPPRPRPQPLPKSRGPSRVQSEGSGSEGDSSGESEGPTRPPTFRFIAARGSVGLVTHTVRTLFPEHFAALTAATAGPGPSRPAPAEASVTLHVRLPGRSVGPLVRQAARLEVLPHSQLHPRHPPWTLSWRREPGPLRELGPGTRAHLQLSRDAGGRVVAELLPPRGQGTGGAGGGRGPASRSEQPSEEASESGSGSETDGGTDSGADSGGGAGAGRACTGAGEGGSSDSEDTREDAPGGGQASPPAPSVGAARLPSTAASGLMAVAAASGGDRGAGACAVPGGGGGEGLEFPLKGCTHVALLPHQAQALLPAGLLERVRAALRSRTRFSCAVALRLADPAAGSGRGQAPASSGHVHTATLALNHAAATPLQLYFKPRTLQALGGPQLLRLRREGGELVVEGARDGGAVLLREVKLTPQRIKDGVLSVRRMPASVQARVADEPGGRKLKLKVKRRGGKAKVGGLRPWLIERAASPGDRLRLSQLPDGSLELSLIPAAGGGPGLAAAGTVQGHSSGTAAQGVEDSSKGKQAGRSGIKTGAEGGSGAPGPASAGLPGGRAGAGPPVALQQPAGGGGSVAVKVERPHEGAAPRPPRARGRKQAAPLRLYLRSPVPQAAAAPAPAGPSAAPDPEPGPQAAAAGATQQQTEGPSPAPVPEGAAAVLTRGPGGGAIAADPAAPAAGLEAPAAASAALGAEADHAPGRCEPHASAAAPPSAAHPADASTPGPDLGATITAALAQPAPAAARTQSLADLAAQMPTCGKRPAEGGAAGQQDAKRTRQEEQEEEGAAQAQAQAGPCDMEQEDPPPEVQEEQRRAEEAHADEGQGELEQAQLQRQHQAPADQDGPPVDAPPLAQQAAPPLLPAPSLSAAHLRPYTLPPSAPAAPPALQPGELRLCGLTFHPALAPAVRRSLAAWEAALSTALRAEGLDGGLSDAALLKVQVRVLDGARLATAGIRETKIRRKLAKLLRLTGGVDAPLPPHAPQLGPDRLAPGPDAGRGGAGLFAAAALRKGAVLGVMGGYVMPGAEARRFAARGWQALGAEARAELEARGGGVAAASGGGAGQRARFTWQLLEGSMRLPMPGSPDGWQLSMLGYGSLAALINGPRRQPRGWLEGSDVGDEGGAAARAANCTVVPVSVRGLALPVVVAVRDVAPGKQLLRDYGAEWWREREEAWWCAEEMGAVRGG